MSRRPLTPARQMSDPLGLPLQAAELSSRSPLLHEGEVLTGRGSLEQELKGVSVKELVRLLGKRQDNSIFPYHTVSVNPPPFSYLWDGNHLLCEWYLFCISCQNSYPSLCAGL